MSNTALTGAYRGAGRPEAIYLIERLMDAAARELKLDPAELRRRNLIRPEQMPYTNPMEQTYDCGEFEKMLDQALALADWNGFAARRAASGQRGWLRGRAVSTFLEWTGGNALTEQVAVNVLPEGIIELRSATQAMGQGIATSYAQLAVDVFGVPIECIRVLQGDTDRANGFGSAGSRSLFTGGAAVSVASQRTVDHAKELAAEALEAAAADIEYREGAFVSPAPTSASGCSSWPRASPTARIRADGSATAGAPELAERLPRVRGRDRPGDRHGRDRRVRVGQRHRPRRQPDDRARADRRRRDAGHRPGAVRARRLRRRQRPGADRDASWTTPAARGRVPRLQDAVRHSRCRA